MLTVTEPPPDGVLANDSQQATQSSSFESTASLDPMLEGSLPIQDGASVSQSSVSKEPVSSRLRPRSELIEDNDEGSDTSAMAVTPTSPAILVTSPKPVALEETQRRTDTQEPPKVQPSEKHALSACSCDLLEATTIKEVSGFLSKKYKRKVDDGIRTSPKLLEDHLADPGLKRPTKLMQLVMHLRIDGWQWCHVAVACNKVFRPDEEYKYRSLRAKYHREKSDCAWMGTVVYKDWSAKAVRI